ncbi:hypothetical protein SNEBB_007432 [Seison nebaliae]|nr:hypothetical protein SNEBB_007432 [Seison nebaliae]
MFSFKNFILLICFVQCVYSQTIAPFDCTNTDTPCLNKGVCAEKVCTCTKWTAGEQCQYAHLCFHESNVCMYYLDTTCVKSGASTSLAFKCVDKDGIMKYSSDGTSYYSDTTTKNIPILPNGPPATFRCYFQDFCMNGGTCYINAIEGNSLLDNQYCSCPTYFTGPKCETLDFGNLMCGSVKCNDLSTSTTNCTAPAKTCSTGQVCYQQTSSQVCGCPKNFVGTKCQFFYVPPCDLETTCLGQKCVTDGFFKYHCTALSTSVPCDLNVQLTK